MNFSDLPCIFVAGMAFGVGTFLVSGLIGMLGQRKSMLARNLEQLELRNKLLEDSNSINRIAASCAVDLKRIAQTQHAHVEKQWKAEKTDTKLLEGLEVTLQALLVQLNREDPTFHPDKVQPESLVARMRKLIAEAKEGGQ